MRHLKTTILVTIITLFALGATGCTTLEVRLWHLQETGTVIPWNDAAAIAEWTERDPISHVEWAPHVESAVVAAALEFGTPMDWFTRMIQCESGGNPAAQNSRSSASGLAQFLDSSWTNVAGRLGYDSSRATQYDPVANARAAAFYHTLSGTSPWNASRHCWG